MEQLLAVDADEWVQELEGHKRFFDTFEGRVPAELLRQKTALRERLKEAVAA
jgi:GTP-dependent phosphoenolpyruvate carboxykinase